MPRRRLVEEPVSHERWLVSYADFITLLFAFFVVMYSISQVNEGKYKVLSETLTEAFDAEKLSPPERKIDPIQVGEVAKSNPVNLIELETSAIVEREGEVEALEEGESIEPVSVPDEFQQINSQLEASFEDLLQQEMITIRGNEEWLEVELKSSLLFSSGDAQLSNEALEILGSIADTIKGQPNPVRVEGFTDDRPINTPLFPSNWELSTARASAVVQLFVEEGVDPGRLAAIGYGEFQPVADNNTEQGRSANRRVVLMISKTGELRPALRQLATVEELIQSGVESSAQTGIEIIIPGVSPDPVEAEETPATETEEQGNLRGVRTIELNDGGLLFTNDPVPEDE